MLWLLTAALAQTLVSPDYPAHCQSPQWSPDGAMLSWEVNWLERKSIELYVAPFTGSLGAPRKIQPVSRASSATAGFSTSTSAVHHELSFAPPAFSPFFIYASSGAGQDYDLYLSSGGALSPEAAALLEALGDAVLQKPFTRATLLDALAPFATAAPR